MKKILLLLVTILSLVSCSTVTVSSPLKIDVVLPTNTSPNDVQTLEIQEIIQEPTIIGEPTIEFNVSILEEFATQTAKQLEKGIVSVFAIEGSYNVIEESTNEVTQDVLIEKDEEKLEVREEHIETTSGEELSSDTRYDLEVSNNDEMPVVPMAPVQEAKSSLIDKLIAFFLREKLFWFGVLTVCIGIIMLIIAFIRDIISACSRHSKKTVKASTKKKSSKAKNEEALECEEKQEDSNATSVALDDNEAFLRSLLDK